MLCAILLLAGCGSALELVQTGRDLIETLAERGGWTRAEYAGADFTLIGYHRYAARGGDLSVYIEGDGANWIDRRQPADPTPEAPDSFRLAMADPAPNRLYLARPCQFLPAADLARCNPAYWGQRRHAPEVVAALNAAIDREKAASGAGRVLLHGKSGGGVEAALLAARRDDVAFLMTAAAYLDTGRWTTMLGVTPLTGSLNPADAVARLAAIPQVHLAGADDAVVPPAVVQSYAARFGARQSGPASVDVVVLRGFDHACCWRREWPRLLATYRRLP
jgi:hypothetical protein